MPQVLLLLPSNTYRASDFLGAARRLGADVIVGTDHEQTLEGAMGDRSLRLDLSDVGGATSRIIEHSKRVPIDAVVAVEDKGVEVAAAASAALGLRHPPTDAIALTRDKLALRRALDGTGVSQPAFVELAAGDDAGELCGELGFPCVIKPTSMSASRGVIRADDPGEARGAAARIRRILALAGRHPDAPLLAEKFVPGVEVALEGLMRGGRLEVLALFDKPDPLDGPYFEETIYLTPSRLDPELASAVVDEIAAAAGAIGLDEGPLHAELRISGGTPVLVEVAARSIGGLCSRSLRFGMGITLEELILRHALDMPIHHTESAWKASGAMMLPIPCLGTLRFVAGVEDARRVPGVIGVEITIPKGAPVVPLPEGDRYLGFAFATGDSPEEVERSLRTARSLMTFEIEPQDTTHH